MPTNQIPPLFPTWHDPAISPPPSDALSEFLTHWNGSPEFAPAPFLIEASGLLGGRDCVWAGAPPGARFFRAGTWERNHRLLHVWYRLEPDDVNKTQWAHFISPRPGDRLYQICAMLVPPNLYRAFESIRAGRMADRPDYQDWQLHGYQTTIGKGAPTEIETTFIIDGQRLVLPAQDWSI